MNRFTGVFLITFVSLCGGLLIAAGLAKSNHDTIAIDGEVITESEYRAYKDGVRAKEQRVPANANPYLTYPKKQSVMWLNGWMDAQKKGEAK